MVDFNPAQEHLVRDAKGQWWYHSSYKQNSLFAYAEIWHTCTDTKYNKTEEIFWISPAQGGLLVGQGGQHNSSIINVET